jgi:hypothetical protein
VTSFVVVIDPVVEIDLGLVSGLAAGKTPDQMLELRRLPASTVLLVSCRLPSALAIVADAALLLAVVSAVAVVSAADAVVLVVVAAAAMAPVVAVRATS